MAIDGRGSPSIVFDNVYRSTVSPVYCCRQYLSIDSFHNILSQTISIDRFPPSSIVEAIDHCCVHCPGCDLIANYPDNWFRVLSIKWNCQDNWFRRLSINWNYPDHLYRRPPIKWNCLYNLIRRLPINWNWPGNWRGQHAAIGYEYYLYNRME